MKVFHLLILTSAVFLFVSCEKEEMPNAALSTVHENSPKNISGNRMLYSFYACDNVIFGIPCNVYPLFCAWPPYGCLPTVVVRGRMANDDLDDFLDHINRGTYDNYFSGQDYKRTFGIVDSFPTSLRLLKEGNLSFIVQRGDTLDRHLYVIGYDASLEPSTRTPSDELIVFEIDHK